MPYVNSNPYGDVKRAPLFDISVSVSVVDWPGGRLAVVSRDRDTGFRVDLNSRHEHVQALLRAPSKRARTRALARLFKLIGRNLRAVSGLSPIEFLAVQRSVEVYFQ